jgi:cytochrome c-type biogenesis protein CcsB
MAHLSDTLFTTAIAIYALALISYAAEYAFGRRGRVATTAAQSVTAAATIATESAKAVSKPKVLVGAGGPSVLDDSDAPITIDPALDGAEPPKAKRPWGDRMGRFAVGLTVLGALVHASSIAVRGAAVDRVPWGNMYEFSAVVGLIAVVAFLISLWRAPQIRYLGLFVMFPVIVLMFLAGTVLYAQASPLVPALQSYWLAIHVSAAASAEGILMTSSVVTLLYLVKQRYEKAVAAGGPEVQTGFVTRFGARLPAAATLDKVAYRAAAFAFPIYTFGIICGAIWAEAAWGRYWGWDPKETWAFISWVIYAAYLHARATGGMRKFAPWINLLGFGAMTFNFFVVNIVISGLHSYAGLN